MFEWMIRQPTLGGEPYDIGTSSSESCYIISLEVAN
jgi:hypothetical protein